MVVWSRFINGSPTGPVRPRVYSSDGEPASSPIALAASGSYPRLLRLANGNFLAAWATQTGVKATVLSVCGLGSPTCGDGAVDPPCEVCDDGAANSDTQPDACRTTCRPAACGDHVIDSGEECDDGNREGDDGCDQNCLIEFCGNHRQEASATTAMARAATAATPTVPSPAAATRSSPAPRSATTATPTTATAATMRA
jgi:cysteine-rich repeat protein